MSIGNLLMVLKGILKFLTTFSLSLKNLQNVFLLTVQR
ncbi:hypothetical protein EZS27_022580 [termite gut metagenome]|uniref:Uncharacterized protein n=1 Tax=termite gut metagenome TaxID=433724 RepID=A0A5J4R4P4_9ZZZZ